MLATVVPPRDAQPLGEKHPAEHVENAAGHVAGEQRLPPGHLRLADPDLVAEGAQGQVPAEGAEHIEDGQREEGGDQPEHVEMDALGLDLRPLADHRQHQEAEDEQRDSELDRELHPLAARRPGAESGARVAYPVQEWSAGFHEIRTLVTSKE